MYSLYYAWAIIDDYVWSTEAVTSGAQHVNLALNKPEYYYTISSLGFCPTKEKGTLCLCFVFLSRWS